MPFPTQTDRQNLRSARIPFLALSNLVASVQSCQGIRQYVVAFGYPACRRSSGSLRFLARSWLMFGDEYHYRLETDAKRRFLELLRERFNTGVRCGGHVLKWDTVIEQKALELGRYLLGRSARLDFLEPSPKLTRIDDREIRKRILTMSEAEARQSGIRRSTYYHLRRNSRSRGSLGIYKKTRIKLQQREIN